MTVCHNLDRTLERFDSLLHLLALVRVGEVCEGEGGKRREGQREAGREEERGERRREVESGREEGETKVTSQRIRYRHF